ncbi:ATP-dependent DNA helicase [Pseudarthrobacter sp. J75]|uniref:ATP-dependent DNA helicase n=1 Tax=unclassified Pseudarthrobacter TaxID=2647000 RepID=UPI002E80789D|nr:MULTISPECIES: ATP-dependent DNA helicase [unclassified Pseudarthrobacter]MEE2521839.1 ATP-dependent DNA helicase [Pseudarthrobacter sp. J47]MEE2527916.1 ATP-dependent DNA helicase [Pseudarthrobacter sp. J75]
MTEVAAGTTPPTAVEQFVLELLDTAVEGMGGQSREGQHQMAREVARAIETGEHLLVQAGTGTGKSLAYLIPLIAHSLVSNKPTLVSTATLALQTQIVGRDLPRLLKTLTPALDRPVKVALVKGRSNYVCRHKLEGGFPSEEPSEGQLFSLGEDTSVPHFAAAAGGPASALGKEVVRLREWAEKTGTGDRDELLPGVTDRAWRQVSVTSMECLGAQKCPLAEECFSELARQDAADADVVVTNHAMLAVSAFEGLAVLPEYDVVVVDEAHELQDRVTGAVSGQLSVAMVHAAAAGARKHTAITVDALNAAAANLELALAGVSNGLLPNGLNAEQLDCVDQLREACRAALSDSKGDSSGTADGGRQLARSRLIVILELCERLLLARENREVVWISRASSFDPQQGYSQPDDSAPALVNIAPLSVAGKLREGLFAGHTVVLTSATLAIGSAFEPTAGGLGLVGDGAPSWTGLDVGSPFDYPRQGILYVAGHLPKPGRGTSPEALDELEALIKASGGGALCLFSSRRAAEEAAEAMRSRMDVKILCQGESTMTALVKQFGDERDTCLFGTMSLWQGVDVPGDSCRLVVIDRIPFPRPDDPLMTARSRSVAQAGGNGFMAVSATHAAVRLAQGAGRLIRSTRDRGVVAVLDSRLSTERYGNFLRSALPPFWPTRDPKIAYSALARLAETK